MHGGKRTGAGRKRGGLNQLRRDLQKLITEKDVTLAMATLRSKMKTEKDVESAKYLLDQKYGKARQRVEEEVEGKVEVRLTIRDMTQRK